MRKNPVVMTLVGYEKKQCGYFFTFCINHIQISPATIKVQLCSAINSIALLMLMLHSLWRHLAACFIIFLKVSSWAWTESSRVSSSSSKDTCNCNYNCLYGHKKSSKYWHYCNNLPRNKVQSFFAKEASLSKTFSMAYMILATYTWRSF